MPKVHLNKKKAVGVARILKQKGTGRLALAAIMACAIALTVFTLVQGTGIASGAANADVSTVGVGATQSSLNVQDHSFNAEEKLGGATEGQTSQLAQATRRSISVDDPQPVVELAAVDLGDESTIKAAAKIGVLNPPKTAKRLTLDTSGEGWMVGEASGYNVETSSTLTRSGRAFDDDCVTVAVPEGQEELLGHPVIIVYEGKVVVATVTDTGGFAKYGRVLDLGGGVHKAFGFEDIWEWGVREVRYKFL